MFEDKKDSAAHYMEMIMMAMRKEERTPKKARQLVAEAETNFFFCTREK